MVRVIFHVDMDSFYASVEVRENPRLKGRPVIIGADPKSGRGRGVVAACSYEAREYGVRSAMPISRAYRLCPDGVYLKPNFDLYERFSNRVMKILRRYADRFEQTSIDEAYLDLSDSLKDIVLAEEVALKIKDEIFRREGLTCSIGVASNKSLAKIASDYRKPDGLTIVYPQEIRIFLDPLPVSKIPGVGKKASQTLDELGIKTIGQLANSDVTLLKKHLGKVGHYIWQIANGIDDTEVREEADFRSMSAEHTYEEDVDDRRMVSSTLDMLAKELYDRLVSEGYLFRTVTLKIRFEDFETHTRSKSSPEYIQSRDILVEYANNLLKEFDADMRRVRLIGLKISKLKPYQGEQKTLLTWT